VRRPSSAILFKRALPQQTWQSAAIQEAYAGADPRLWLYTPYCSLPAAAWCGSARALIAVAMASSRSGM
jgi:hypothetical protein